MARLESVTPFALAHYRKEGYARQEMDVMAVRATFRWTEDGAPLKLAEVQQPIRWGESYEGPQEQILRCVVGSDGDVEIGKPTTDIHVCGHLMAPSGRAQRDWLSHVRVGDTCKTLGVCGPRQFEKGLMGWRPTRPEPVEHVRLDYRHAFGGIQLASQLDAHGHPEYCAFAGNPAGQGWLPDEADLKPLPKAARQEIERKTRAIRQLAAPQFEDPRAPVGSPFDRQATQGFGPIARWWSPRKERQGTLDEIWRQYRYPEWPADFDSHYYNSAHPDLMCRTRLQGDETLTLANCVVKGATRRDGDCFLNTQLPGMAVYALAEFEGSETRQLLEFLLDTVSIDLDRQEISMTWHRLCMPQQSLKWALIGGMPLDLMREMKRKHAATLPVAPAAGGAP